MLHTRDIELTATNATTVSLHQDDGAVPPTPYIDPEWDMVAATRRGFTSDSAGFDLLVRVTSATEAPPLVTEGQGPGCIQLVFWTCSLIDRLVDTNFLYVLASMRRQTSAGWTWTSSTWRRATSIEGQFASFGCSATT